MTMNTDPAWLERQADLEDGQMVSAGGWVADRIAADSRGTAMDREWFERRVLLEEGLDVVAGAPFRELGPETVGELPGELAQEEPGEEGTPPARSRSLRTPGAATTATARPR